MKTNAAQLAGRDAKFCQKSREWPAVSIGRRLAGRATAASPQAAAEMAAAAEQLLCCGACLEPVDRSGEWYFCASPRWPLWHPTRMRMATGMSNAFLDMILDLDDPWSTVRREPAQKLTKLAHCRDLD